MPSAEPHSRTLDAGAHRFDLAALPVCGPACDGRPAKAGPVADAGPAALAHGTCMAHLLHVGRSVFNLLESVVVRM
jgi:hypothetical protein